MIFKVLAQFIEQFWHVYWISCCQNARSAKVNFFTLFCYKYTHVTACKKLAY